MRLWYIANAWSAHILMMTNANGCGCVNRIKIDNKFYPTKKQWRDRVATFQCKYLCQWAAKNKFVFKTFLFVTWLKQKQRDLTTLWSCIYCLKKDFKNESRKPFCAFQIWNRFLLQYHFFQRHYKKCQNTITMIGFDFYQVTFFWVNSKNKFQVSSFVKTLSTNLIPLKRNFWNWTKHDCIPPKTWVLSSKGIDTPFTIFVEFETKKGERITEHSAQLRTAIHSIIYD